MYIVWIGYSDGWGYEEFKTLKEAVTYATKNSSSDNCKLTKLVEYEISEVIEK